MNAIVVWSEKFKVGIDHIDKQHDEMVKNIIASVQDYTAGNKFVPNNFVRDLEDWIFSHIAISDRAYSIYVKDQKNNGLITDEMITG